MRIRIQGLKTNADPDPRPDFGDLIYPNIFTNMKEKTLYKKMCFLSFRKLVSVFKFFEFYPEF